MSLAERCVLVSGAGRGLGRSIASADSSQLRWIRVWDKAGNKSGWYHLRL